ncbi:MAG: hypothetical protein NTZ56_04760, partial [Acidobacteria bacterium]|nr:hypothetical protein [Acidobacteriota bacterium]
MFALLLVDSQDERVPEQLDYAGQLRRTFLHFGLSVLSLSVTLRSANVPDAGVFDRIGLRSGLSQAYVRCIFQDRRG